MRSNMLFAVVCFTVLILVGLQVFSIPGSAFTLTVVVDIKPDTLNVRMNGRWITAYIELPEGYNVSDIDVSTIFLEGLFAVEHSDIENDILKVKFDGEGVTDYLWGKLYHMGVNQASVSLAIAGQLRNNTQFSGTDTIVIMNPPL